VHGGNLLDLLAARRLDSGISPVLLYSCLEFENGTSRLDAESRALLDEVFFFHLGKGQRPFQGVIIQNLLNKAFDKVVARHLSYIVFNVSVLETRFLVGGFFYLDSQLCKLLGQFKVPRVQDRHLKDECTEADNEGQARYPSGQKFGNTWLFTVIHCSVP
jgi:hypothetical protein